MSRPAKCGCPYRCKFCGARLVRDWIGHKCPTRNCQWEHGVQGCTSGDGDS